MKFLLQLLTITLITITTNSSLKAQVNTQDSLVLVDLYNSTNGANWTINTNWLTNAPVSSWWGIQVNNNRVTSIYLTLNALNGIGNNLIGVIPSSIGDLSDLDTLNLMFNQLSGSIPTSLGKLANLIHLDLYSNLLTGGIPASLGNLNNLEWLNLYNNQLTGNIPTSLGNLVNLKYLDLYNNLLTGSIPASLGNLIKLEWLNLYNNQLTGVIPPSISNLSNLQQLNLYINQLTGNIPTVLGNLINLVQLNLYNNQLTGIIPSSIGNLTNLQQLELSRNQLTGSIPASFGNLINLQRFIIGENQIGGTIPSSMDNLNNIQLFWILNNQFTFAGMEGIVTLAPGGGTYLNNIYAPQAEVPLYQNGSKIYVSVGGTPSNDTYNWYLNGNLVSTQLGDSTYTPLVKGKYWVVCKNSIATQLTLYSDTLNFDFPPTIISITPDTACPSTVVTIKGSNFIGTTSVTFGNVAAKSFSVINDSTIMAIVGNGASGNLSVVTASGTFNLGGFVYASPTSSTINTSVCSGKNFTFNGNSYSKTGTYTVNLTNSLGCDSILTLNLTINPPAKSITNAIICSGGSYKFNGNSYSTAGTYSSNLTNALGCDSIATLVLTQTSPTTSITNAIICSGGAYTFNGTTYNNAGTYFYHLKNALDCDSIAALNLTVNQTSASTTNATICAGGTYTFNGSTYNTAGTYFSHLENALGCDSVATLNLTVNRSSASTTIASICMGSSYRFNGSVYTSTGIYNTHLINALGCDSIATLNLTVNQPSTSTTNASICKGENYVFNNTSYTSAGTYSINLINSVGCDSIITLVLNTKQPSTSLTKALICRDNSYIFNGSSYSKNGSYIFHLTNSVGCDSAATLSLTVDTVDIIKPINGSDSICKDDKKQLTDSTLGGTWRSTSPLVASIDNMGFISGVNTGIDTIKYLATFNCGQQIASKVIQVFGAKPTITLNLGNSNCIHPTGGFASLLINGTESPYTYFYSNTFYHSTDTISNLSSGEFSVYIYNSEGCLVDSLDIEIKQIIDASCDTLFVPNAFTPTGNQFNIFKPVGGGEDIKSVLFRIYNRFGNMVFESHNLTNGWDGRFNGTLQDTGTFVWYLIYTKADNKERFAKGTCVLIR